MISAFAHFLMLALAGQAQADDAITARNLQLDTPCIAAVHIDVDPGLKHEARYEVEGAAATLSQGSGDTMIITVPSCDRGVLRLHIAPDMGVDIRASRSTSYDLHGITPAISASLSGGRLDVEQSQAMHLGLSGNAVAHIGTMGSAMQVSAGDQAVLRVDHARGNALSGQFLGASRADFADAKLDAVSVVAAGTAQVTVLGETQVATLTSHGNAVINVESVTGALLRHGDGGVRVSHYSGMVIDRRDAGLPIPPPTPTPPAPPSIPAPGDDQ